jgi:L-alanine-DL-glutamate epimerase-like enolase superfamily enzyme
VTFAASLQLCAHAPNTMVMESVRGFCEGWYRDVLEVSPTPDGGMIAIPDEPGLGVQLSEAFLTRSDVTVTRSEA